MEQRSVGEDSEDVVRKSIQLQRDSLRFWTDVALVGDFLIAPSWIALRAFLVAVALSAVAAISGRPVRFPAAMRDCVAWQGVWVLGLAVQVVLMLVLQRSGHRDVGCVAACRPGVMRLGNGSLLHQID